MPIQEEMHSLTQEIFRSYEARAAQVALLQPASRAQIQGFHGARQTLAQNVAGTLRGLHRARQTMARQQREALARGPKELASNVAGYLGGLRGARLTLASNVAGYLGGLRGALSTMAHSVESQLGALHADRAGAQKEWRHLAAALTAKRAGAPPREKSPVAAPASSPTAPPEEAWREPHTSLQDRVFAYLANQPNGTRLTELEEAFQTDRFQMTRVVRSLLDDGKVEKRDLLYHAI